MGIKIGIVGVGKIVRDQHLPAIDKNSTFDLIATASRNASVDGIASYQTIEQMAAAEAELDAVALCMPPQYRFAAARFAIEQGLHVLLEKPPGATVSEVEILRGFAERAGVSLFATWHSRFGAAVVTAKSLLARSTLQSAQLIWREDVRKWHPGQEWIWQAGGLGVFDPGINGLSILSHVLPMPLYVKQSKLSFPVNKVAPIAAELILTNAQGVEIKVDFDWRETEGEQWNIVLQTDLGEVCISDGGAQVSLQGEAQVIEPSNEYELIYHRFAQIVNSALSDVDLAPLKLVADAFLLGDRETLEAFIDN